jgi:hypothetical protein
MGEFRGMRAGLGAIVLLASLTGLGHGAVQKVKRTIKADIVALDQPFFCNRLGTSMPQGMVFALRGDVVSTDPTTKDLKPGKVALRPGKRPRPIVLRMNVGDAMDVTFTNLLAPVAPKTFPSSKTLLPPSQETVTTREASVHAMGMQLARSVADDGSWVGMNNSSLYAPVKPGDPPRHYVFIAEREGPYLLYSTAADVGAANGNVDAGQLSAGLFGAVTVQPEGAEWYRSQVTNKELVAAARKGPDGRPLRTADGHLIINYDAIGADGNPILKMLDANSNLIYSDLTALITGPNHGNFDDVPADPNLRPNPVLPPVPPPAGENGRLEPYREIVIHYHDALTALQAFPAFIDSGNLVTTLNQGGDKFAINYGIAGIGAEIYANRIGVGPMSNSVESKFEEFFLSSWVVGDPAMIVDKPANSIPTGQAPPGGGEFPTGLPPSPTPAGPKATKALFADDPSNVYHSYLHDHVKFRVLHAGANITHVHHQHAHQWLRTPNSDNSMLLDSQMITPGDAYTLEMIYGSGNRNMTAGDSIFHCHFYPHFAEGMWSLWRVHDVFEEGTPLDAAGRPLPVSRALPDGEIALGTPIPALVPIPTLPMAPTPPPVKLVAATGPKGAGKVGQRAELVNPVADAKKNPGYPFFIPGVAGHRAPHPPYDFAVEQTPAGPLTLDGGLPRHLILGPDMPGGGINPPDTNGVIYQRTNQWDFSKDNLKLFAMELPEDGTQTEKAAIQYMKDRFHDTFFPDGTAAVGKDGFKTNGAGPKPGAPFADPGIDDAGKPITATRRYKAADIQLDVVFNKKGWHYPQQRMISLWEDVKPTLAGQKAPEPLFIRANSGEVVEYWLANLVPDYYDLDDFQVQTPTDIIGQHIHLVKFDVLASDGAANGFNYEDGTFSPQTVVERIGAIKAVGGLWTYDPTWQFTANKQIKLTPKTIPFFGPGPNNAWVGAQATVQRWWADPLVNLKGEDRTLQTVFTHDHFGPSTHQQAGLYAGLLIEPAGSKWSNPATGAPMPDPVRQDGGPTSWEAIIAFKDQATLKDDSFREFALEFQDLQLAYQLPAPGASGVTSPVPYPRGYTTLPTTPWGWSDPANAINAANLDGSNNPTFAPSLISPGPEQGTRSLNYRNEPIPLRVSGATAMNYQANPEFDLSQAYRSIRRNDPQLNTQPSGPIKGTPFFYPGGFAGAGDLDPYTPLLRAYENDKVRVRVLAGAHLLPHAFNIQGVNWLTESYFTESGYRSTQPIGLSEHFEMFFTVPTTYAPTSQPSTPGSSVDYLYMPSSSYHGQLNGLWGILRSYKGPIGGLATLPTNKAAKSPDGTAAKIRDFLAKQPVRPYKVTATTSGQALAKLSGGNLNYNTRTANGGPIQDPNAVIYVFSDDLNPDGTLKSGIVEPLILRAKAGEVIQVTLTNQVDPTQGAFAFVAGSAANPGPFALLKASPLSSVSGATSINVGFHPQLVSYDITQSNGFNVGNNTVQSVAPGATSTQPYTWYAGNLTVDAAGNVTGVPVEFGAINLLPSDTILQTPTGLYAALVIEPANTTSWTLDPGSRASATVTTADGKSFREFVAFVQESANVGNAAINYRTEPWPSRVPANNNDYNSIDASDVMSNSAIAFADPQTPVFLAPAGMPTRFRFVHPGPYNNADFNAPDLTIHGHVWPRQPFRADSTVLGANPLSEWTGSTGAFVPNDQLNILLDQAGGVGKVPGDYLYRSILSSYFANGMWGIFRVVDPKQDIILVQNGNFETSTLTLSGVVRPPFEGGQALPKAIVLTINGKSYPPGQIKPDGSWTLTAANLPTAPTSIKLQTTNGSVEIAAPFGPRPRAAIGLAPAAAPPMTPESARSLAVPDRRFIDALRFSPQVAPGRKRD